MVHMFVRCPFDQDLSSWNVSNVTSISMMFYSSPFNGNISNWDVSNVSNMHRMFDSSVFNDISTWDIDNVNDMGNMFGNGNAMSAENKCAIHTSFSSNSSWQYDWSEDQDCNGACFGDATLDECGVCEGPGPDQHFTCDGTFKPETKDALQVAVDLWTCTRFENDCDNELALSTYGHISNWDVSLITDMSNVFYHKTTFNDDIGSWDVSNVLRT